jgi:hypothetical protein
MIRMRRHLMIEGQRGYSKTLRAYFTKILNRICDRVQHAGHMSATVPMTKASVDIGFGSHEALWRQAIQDVLGTDANVELMADTLPTMQSVIAKANSRTSLFLGHAVPVDAAVQVLQRAQGMARLVTRINETTRNQLATTLDTALANGDTLVQVVNQIRDEIPDVLARRVPTIARTEIGRAIDQGTIMALKQSTSVTHCMVVGCQAIEPGIPELDGVATCNIAGVPVHRLDELSFHINHGGALIAQYYYSDNYSGPIYSGGLEKKKK